MHGAVVAITGGATGMGLAAAKAYAGRGFRVALGGRRIDVVEKALQSLPAGSDARGYALDVADRGSVDSFFQSVRRDLGEVDILIHAAGVNIKNRSMQSMEPDQWDEVMAINATGAYNCLRAVLPGMKAKKNGLVILISSVAGKRALALGGIAYSASKFAMTALGTCVSNEVAAEGIRVTNVYPGEVNTPILDNRPTPVSEEHRASILQPEDVGEVLLQLALLPNRVHIPELVVKPLMQSWY